MGMVYVRGEGGDGVLGGEGGRDAFFLRCFVDLKMLEVEYRMRTVYRGKLDGDRISIPPKGNGRVAGKMTKNIPDMQTHETIR